MGFLQRIFGKKPEPEKPAEEPGQLQSIKATPIGPANYGYPAAHVEALDPAQILAVQHQAIDIHRAAALYDQQAQAVEALIDGYQRLYGRQVQHQSRLQQLHQQRFPIELMAASLVIPGFQQQAPAPAAQKASKVRSKARKILND